MRMEPVFMMLGEAAAVVASLAIDAGTPLQQVPYQGVRQTLSSVRSVAAAGHVDVVGAPARTPSGRAGALA
jgi:hypothetical protein